MLQSCVLKHPRRDFKQAKLEGEQAALKLRLKQALRLAKAPRTHVDTLTVADKAIALLDKMLEVGVMLLVHLILCLEGSQTELVICRLHGRMMDMIHSVLSIITVGLGLKSLHAASES